MFVLLARLALCLSLMIASLGIAAELLSPTQLSELKYDQTLLPGNYNPAIPHPDAILGFPVGSRAATPSQIVEVIQAITAASDRTLLVEYARSHEKRPLYYVVISSPGNLARIEQVKADVKRLADPRNLGEAEANVIIENLPALAWMSYSIHGDESSGADAALAAIYHLAASIDDDIEALLDKEIVIIDPSQNPDGRARFVKFQEETRGIAPNIDDQSMLHSQYWPGGRYNHYFFDLNRDYILGVQPETRGRVKAFNEWRPQLVIDAHEMGSQTTYHFTPSREPINLNVSQSLRDWNVTFAKDQAAVFDSHGWPYFNGEAFDDFYPGYTAFSQYRGALNILYEQAGLSEDGVRRRSGEIITYREAVHHQLISTLVNLKTLAKHSQALYRDYLDDRRMLVSDNSPYANRTFVVLPTDNQARLDNFVTMMQLQGFEIYEAEKAIPVKNALTQMGHTLARATIPKGALILPNRQPEARLLATMLEFDAEVLDEVLIKERQSLLRGEGSTMYDIGAWNATMLKGLEAWTVPMHLDNDVRPFQTRPAAKGAVKVEHVIGYVVNGNDDRAPGFAARAMEIGLNVRVITKAAELDSKPYPRGSIAVIRNDNRSTDLFEPVDQIASELGIVAQGFTSGMGPGDFPDTGGRYFVALERPRIALVSRGRANPLGVGAIWHSLDENLGIRHSLVDLERLLKYDLRRYNVIIFPDMRAMELSEKELSKLSDWIKNGGTLVAVKSAAAAFSAADKMFTKTRLMGDTFEDQSAYDLALQREWLSSKNELSGDIWSNSAPVDVDYPWTSESKSPGKTTLEKLDKWQKIFQPSGVMLAGKVDQYHWLTFGTGETLPLLVGRVPILMTDGSSEAVVRYGVLKKMESTRWEQSKREGGRKIGWATLPDQYELDLRMSGFLWPEAAQRMANAAYLTRESKGNGQIILFADDPNFRGAAAGTNRLLLNAIVFGPGLGASHPIIP